MARIDRKCDCMPSKTYAAAAAFPFLPEGLSPLELLLQHAWYSWVVEEGAEDMIWLLGLG